MSCQTIVFRADASLTIGTGHVMRCLTLADGLHAHGVRCHFVCREHPGNLIDEIVARGHSVSVLPMMDELTFEKMGSDWQLAHSDWLGTSWQTDATQTIEAIKGIQPDWLIVDHYALDVRWEKALRPLCQNLMLIDDLADRTHDCDMLLNQNLGRSADDYKGLLPADCVLLIGPMYALLRPEFAALREYSLARREHPQLRHLLITMGGVDKDNATGAVLNALRKAALPSDCNITVVMGPHAPWLNEVQKQAEQMPWKTEVKVNIQNMARLMAESDLAIGAAGSTSWERCAMGLPSGIVVLADNQIDIAKKLEAAGAAIAITLDCLGKKIDLLLKSTKALPEMSKLAAQITEGTGLIRVVARMRS